MPVRRISDMSRREYASVEDKQKKKKMLSGGQAKLDKNKNNKIDAQDFKILRAEKAKGRGQGLQDEKMKPGKVMKAQKGRSIMTRGGGVDSSVLGRIRDAGPMRPIPVTPPGGPRVIKDSQRLKRLMNQKNKREKIKEGIKKIGSAVARATPLGAAAAAGRKAAKRIRAKASEKKPSGPQGRKGRGGGGSKPAPKPDPSLNPNPKTPKMMGARKGDFIKRRMMLAGKSDGDTSFDAKKRAQDMGVIDKKTGAGRKRFMEAAKSVKLGKRLLIPIAIGIAGVQALKSKMKKDKKEKPKKKMGGGMMQRPMGMYKKGMMVKARGGGMARTKPTKMY
jgi:hypothetical protein